MRKIFSVIALAVILVGCSENKSTGIKDIIPPVKLTAGVEKTVIISDLFYAPNYQLKFMDNEKIEVIFEDKKLTLKAKPNFEGFTTLEFDYEGNPYFIPVYSRIVENVKFSFRPEKSYKVLTLFGNFNGWNRQELPLNDDNGDGKYDISIPLEPGRYEYKFFGDGEEIPDPENKNIVPNGLGGFNSIILIEDKHTEKIFLQKDSSFTIPTGKEFIFLLESGVESELDCGDVTVLLDNVKLSAREVVCYENKVKVFLDNYQLAEHNMLRVVADLNGLVSNMQMVPLHGDQFSWYNASIYSLMVDRFNDGDDQNNIPVKHDSLEWKANYMGGDLQGVINKLDDGYFSKLGINTLWISPIYSNPNEAFQEYPAPHRYYSGYHGYWPTHHLMVEEKFGDMVKLKRLIDVAHKKNIKVLLDFVSNHVHQEHPFYKNHPEWFGKLELPDGSLNLRLWDEQRLTTWFEPYLPSFDYEGSEEALEAMTDNAIWWLKTTGADGFRHDAVKHVPNKFWRRLTQKIKEQIEIPNDVKVYQIGETFGNYEMVSSYVNPGQLSAQFNFEIYNVAQGVFVDKNRSFKELADELAKTSEVYGAIHYMGNIMDSHDKDRFMAAADGDLVQNQNNSAEIGWTNPPVVDHPESYRKAELYYAFMFSIPGLPVIYYGSEFGMTGAADPDNRRMMRFDKDLNLYEKDLLGKVSQISNLRNTNTALRTGDFYTLMADENIFAYVRSDFNERVLVVLNKNDKPINVKVELPAAYDVKSATSLKDGSEYAVEENVHEVKLDGYSWNYYLLM
ncbi:MAG: alpha-glucosidase C-terminal domain-containing protein [Bacteroidetes bacterium]|nr:alpha-glucosidase C-terminal domain-containing protein [Bacteroidota bacterium]